MLFSHSDRYCGPNRPRMTVSVPWLREVAFRRAWGIGGPAGPGEAVHLPGLRAVMCRPTRSSSMSCRPRPASIFSFWLVAIQLLKARWSSAEANPTVGRL